MWFSWRGLVLLFALSAGITAAQEVSGSFAALAAQAKAARNANDVKSAILLYRRALQLNPQWQEGWWMAGSLQYDTEQYADGAESLRHLVELIPGNGAGWALLGLCEYETGDYAGSLEHIQRSLTIGVGDQPQMVLVLKFHQAALLTKMGQFDAALQRYSSFLPSKVADRQVLLGLGLTALHRAATPAEIIPEQTDMFLTAGRALAAFLTGDHADAETAYQGLIDRFPNDANVRYAYGYSLFGTDQDKAITEWTRTLSIDPQHAAANAMLGWTYWLRGDTQKSFAYAQKAVTRDPNSTVAQIVLGRSMVQTGQVNKGIEYLERAVRAEPANLEAHLALATGYSQAGRKSDAQRERQFCLRMQAETEALAQR